MNLLTRVLVEPELLEQLSLGEWDALLRFAYQAGMLGALHALINEQGRWQEAPAEVRETLESAMVYTAYMQRIAGYELRKLSVLLQGVEYPVVLLKGAAYLLAQLPSSAGRRLNDIDLLVPRNALADIEARLKAAGWRFPADLGEYDLRYYREWTHELPPMRHASSYMELDVHHSLIQPTGRIGLDPARLFECITPVPAPNPHWGDVRFYTLGPEDLFLHSATHLFMSDELRGGLRDLYDMYRLGLHFAAQDPGYWSALVARAGQLDMARPLYYALSSLRELLGLDYPAPIQLWLRQARPNFLARQVMRRAIQRHLAPGNVDRLNAPVAEWLLYVRSHWVRMPPLMLVKHLWVKWRMGRQQAATGQPAEVGE